MATANNQGSKAKSSIVRVKKNKGKQKSKVGPFCEPLYFTVAVDRLRGVGPGTFQDLQ